MYGREKRVLLRHYLEQGLTKTALAEKLGISRRSIYHWMQTGQLDRDLDAEVARYRSRPPVPRKIDPYRGIILHRLQAYPELSAVRLFHEIKAAGYPGGYTQVKEFVRQVRPRPPKEPVIRFETPPGRQAQVDFAHFRLPWGRRYGLLVVLGYSRLLWLRFYRRKDMRSLFAGLEEAFRFFGGVPQEILFDQMRSVIVKDERLEGGRLIENLEFLRFAHHWQFRPRACRPYRAKTKGKVERPIRYVRQSFIYGREFLGDADLNAQVEHWLRTIANVRDHRTTRERPIDRFLRDEKATLKPLAPRPYHSLVLAADRDESPRRKTQAPRPALHVERRPLRLYSQIAGGPR
ncbi:MAG: IS21 family transposase [Gemmatimonadales bacterium]|nr:IS21 family transposase [Gemmatimonadales bacterium]NIS65950.1 IS21 family transposase [Gemmatimonadales bacterium]